MDHGKKCNLLLNGIRREFRWCYYTVKSIAGPDREGSKCQNQGMLFACALSMEVATEQ